MPEQQSIELAILLPGGNPTAIVTTPLDQQQHSLVAKQLRGDRDDTLSGRLSGLRVEEVGFYTEGASDAHLAMMGGELSIDGILSAAALKCHRGGDFSNLVMTCSGIEIGTFEVSAINSNRPGASYDVELTFRWNEGYTWPTKPGSAEIGRQIWFVELPGISYFITYQSSDSVWNDSYVRDQKIKDDLQQYLGQYESHHQNAPAIGLVWHRMPRTNDGKVKENTYEICAAVWVRKTDSIEVETACGSGGLAVLLMASQQKPTMPLKIIQLTSAIHECSYLDDQNGFKIKSPVEVLLDGRYY